MYLGNPLGYRQNISSNQSNGKSFRKYWLLVLILPLFFVVKWFVSYGQISVKKISDEQKQFTEDSEANRQKVELPRGAWYNRTLKSWFWEMPSVEDVLAKDIEVTGGWKSLKPLETVELSADTYNIDCRLDPDVLPHLKSNTVLTLKYKQPDKYLMEDAFTFSGQKYQTFTNGKMAYSVMFIRETEKFYEQITVDPSGDYGKGFISVAENWAENYDNFTDISVEKFGIRDTYTFRAHRRKPVGKKNLGIEQLYFDVITGRLIGNRIYEAEIQFGDFRKIKDMFLPYSICVDTGSSYKKLVIKEWKINEFISDSDFEKPGS